MKKTMILMLAVCLAVLSCTALAETAQQSPIHGARYFFEHKMIPQLFYEDPESMMKSMKDGGAFDLWKRFTEQNKIDLTYSAEDFDVREFPQEDGMEMVMISLPKPPDSPLCSRIYLCYIPETRTGGVYTVEYDNMFGDTWFLCGWTKDGTHQNYGGAMSLAPADSGYEEGLRQEAEQVRRLMLENVPAAASYDPGDGSVSVP